MQNYLAVFFISNNSVHERYGTNLLTCEYLLWTDTYSAHVAMVSAGQNRRRSTGHGPMALSQELLTRKNVVIEKV